MQRGVVDEAVGPLAQERLDESFGLAVGRGPVGPGEAATQAKAPAGPSEELRSVAVTVVGEQTQDADAVPPYQAIARSKQVAAEYWRSSGRIST